MHLNLCVGTDKFLRTDYKGLLQVLTLIRTENTNGVQIYPLRCCMQLSGCAVIIRAVPTYPALSGPERSPGKYTKVSQKQEIIRLIKILHIDFGFDYLR